MAEPVNCALCGQPAEVVDDRTCFYVRCLPCHEVISSRWVDIDSGTEAENRALADATDWDALRDEAVVRWNAIQRLAAGTHVVVPVEATEAMIDAWWDQKGYGGRHGDAAADWAAMLAAAQKEG